MEIRKRHMEVGQTEAKKIARSVLEQFHTIHSIKATLKDGKWHVSAVVDISKKQTKTLLIDSKTGRVLAYDIEKINRMKSKN